MRRFTWILLSQNAQVIGVDATSLTVGFKTAGARDSFVGGGSEEILRQAAIDMIGADWKVETAVDPSAQPGSETAPRVKPVRRPLRAAVRAAATERAPGRGRATRPRRPAGGARRTPGVDRGGAVQHRADAQRRRAAPPPTGPDPDADAHRDDPVADDNGLDSTELLQRELGATVIEEIPHD